jgi:hypothetical protein
MVRVFMLVYWLASEGPMLMIYTLAMLIRQLDFHAQTSQVLGMMIDESTDTSNKKVCCRHLVACCCTCGFVATVA